jgi:hypothetical protein
MGSLRSALDEYRAVDLAEASDAQIEEGFAELQRACELAELERLRWLAALDRRRPWLRDGHLSTTSWLSETHRLSRSAAAGDVRMARALEAMPATREAVAGGDVSLSGAKALAAARETDQEAFTETEPLLVEAATRHSVRDLHRVVGHWRNAVESRRRTEVDQDPLQERRRLHVSPTVFGMVRIDGDLDPETGETVLTALRSHLDAEARAEAAGDDRRTPGQRRADALGEICGRYLSLTDRPEVGGERPHVTVTMDLESLWGRAGKAELDLTGPIRGETARLIACDALVSRVITGPRSEPLDVGRRTPVVSAALRRAVVVRDRHCRFPGCDRPQAWCDAHHMVHWADGGPTALSNLILLCRRHHRLTHERGGFRVEMVEGRPLFRRPDGSILEERAPP